MRRLARSSALALLALLALLLIAVGRPETARADSDTVDNLGTPRRFVASFLTATDAQDWQTASTLLGATTPAQRNQAALRAKQLAYLIEKRSWVRLDAISDEPTGTKEGTPEKIGSVHSSQGELVITVERTKSTPPHWTFSADTIASVPAVYEERGPTLLEEDVPASLRGSFGGMETWQWIGLPLAALIAIFGSWLSAWIFRTVGRLVSKRTEVRWDDELVETTGTPLRLLAATVIYGVLDYSLALPSAVRAISSHVTITLAIYALTWGGVRIVRVAANSFDRRASRFETMMGVVGSGRGAKTRVQVLRRVITVGIVAIGTGFVLMQFEVVRNVGVSLLASAGVAGIVVGLAAQRTLGSLLAGLQLSFTQPIRIGDTVVIEGEYGTIEEITLTYVVMKVWDERRLVLPIMRFLEQPFQNLTKVKSGQHGAVLLYASWTLPISALRTELDRLLEGNDKWDKRTKSVAVTDAREHSIEVRILVSTADPRDLFDLRAQLRESLVGWLQQYESGAHLPQTRAVLVNAPTAESRPRTTAS